MRYVDFIGVVRTYAERIDLEISVERVNMDSCLIKAPIDSVVFQVVTDAENKIAAMTLSDRNSRGVISHDSIDQPNQTGTFRLIGKFFDLVMSA